jgi:hypothetical protein
MLEHRRREATMNEEESRYEKYEKDEKGREQQEKSEEKTQEKTQEKSWDEKWRRDPLGTLGWALILIWAGVAFLLNNLDLLANVSFLQDLEAWSLVFAGAGAILLALAVVRLILPEYRGGMIANLIFGLILLGVGLGDKFGWEYIWPIIIIFFGLALLFGNLFRKRE